MLMDMKPTGSVVAVVWACPEVGRVRVIKPRQQRAKRDGFMGVESGWLW
jgi:hypothetical protein